jgi:hypothetical protein
MTTPQNKSYFDDDDELINVILPKSDYKIMRDIIERQKSLNWFGRYFRNIIFVAAGGLLALIAFGDQFRTIIARLFGH